MVDVRNCEVGAPLSWNDKWQYT